MLKTLLVIAVGFLPSLFSLWMIRKSHMRRETQMRQAGMSFPRRQLGQNSRLNLSDRYYLEGVGYLIGDISCRYNAKSGYVRCAVNPSGPCEGCRYYEAREFTADNENKV
ncbi:MAG: hypothetical protein KME38_19830 [Spirirestis rafaelensis WJT71-NPBG6]|nr:hypothetical protein [Spirirestis rafaelensis WJT71-NPBG6]